MNANSSKHERREELLALSATEGLCLPQREELDALLAELDDVGADLFESAVAALEVGMTISQPEPQLPAHLLESLTQQGEAIVSACQEDAAKSNSPQAASVSAAAKAVASSDAAIPQAQLAQTSCQSARTSSLWNSLSALSVCVVIAFFLAWFFWPDATIAPQVPLAQQYQQLATTAGTVHVAWNEENLTGEVIWNQERQEGFMKFQGLAINDPTDKQYQLWIFDGLRNSAYPIDGGVFDISAPEQGEQSVIIRIQPKLLVQQPTLFAVTEEAPGGVVVSNRDPIVATASMDNAQ